VADWRPPRTASRRSRRTAAARRPCCLRREPRHPAHGREERARQGRPLFCVGFAAESENLAEHAKAKRERKGIPLLVGNIGPLTFGQDDNALLLVDAKGTRELPRAPKLTLARELMTEIAARLPDWRV
jgi:phosphopantothenoylcysteine decarboxylase/phosphopantothenate--cysteine ligase